MMYVKQMDGMYGNWRILGKHHIDERGRVYWRCECMICGTVKPVRGDNLRRGTSTKCEQCAIREREKRVF